MEKSIVNRTVCIRKEIDQPDFGYRFSEDPLILADHIELKGKEKILDIGTGCGIIPLILATRCPDVNISGVEIQNELYQFAVKNIEHHGFAHRIQIIHKDIADLHKDAQRGLYDIAVSNPPYKKRGSGRLNPESQKALARHEISLDIEGVFKSAQRLLKNRGQLYVIFPAERLDDLVLAMKQHRFSSRFIRSIHTREENPAKRVILNAVKNQNVACSILPPLYLNATFSPYYT